MFRKLFWYFIVFRSSEGESVNPEYSVFFCPPSFSKYFCTRFFIYGISSSWSQSGLFAVLTWSIVLITMRMSME